MPGYMIHYNQDITVTLGNRPHRGDTSDNMAVSMMHYDDLPLTETM